MAEEALSELYLADGKGLFGRREILGRCCDFVRPVFTTMDCLVDFVGGGREWAGSGR